MWWKLIALAVTTIVAILAVIPIKTRAVKYDLMPGGPLPVSARPSLRQLFENMYFAPATFIVIGGILIIAVIVAFWIVRGTA